MSDNEADVEAEADGVTDVDKLDVLASLLVVVVLALLLLWMPKSYAKYSSA